MCGITGIINFSDNLDTFEARLSNRRMSNTIIHRGPDDEGTFESSNCTMSNRRLSIVDIQNGHQPIKSENGRYAMVYNGECYNYLELKQKLIQNDINFKTNSDTEVIFNGLINYGYDFVKKINGIFALAFWDEKLKELLVARDFIGVKPLFYSFINSEKTFIFSSEINSIIKGNIVSKSININSAFEFLSRQSPPHLKTFYDNIYELEPGSYIKFNKKEKKISKYFNLEETFNPELSNFKPKNINEANEYFKMLISNAVENQMIGDVPLGIAFSGGADSSLLLGNLLSSKKQNSDLNIIFSYNQNDKKEGLNTNLIINNLNKDINFFQINNNKLNLFDEFYNCVADYGMPIVFKSNILMKNIAQKANNLGMKVLFSGNGADELLLGYKRQQNFYIEFTSNKDFQYDQFLNFLYFGNGLKRKEDIQILTGLDYENQNYLIKDWLSRFQNLDKVTLLSLFDQKFRLPNLLKREDISGMSQSIEYRVPYLDIDLLKWCNSLKTEYKIYDNVGKYIIKNLAYNFYNSDFFFSDKRGSTSSIDLWFFSNEFKKIFLKMINRKNSYSKNYLDFKYLLNMFEKYEYKEIETLIRNIFSIECWYQNNFN